MVSSVREGQSKMILHAGTASRTDNTKAAKSCCVIPPGKLPENTTAVPGIIFCVINADSLESSAGEAIKFFMQIRVSVSGVLMEIFSRMEPSAGIQDIGTL